MPQLSKIPIVRIGRINPGKICCLFSLCFTILLLGSCSWLMPAPYSPAWAKYVGSMETSAIKSALTERTPSTPITTLKAEWKIKLRIPKQRGISSFRANTLFETPDKLRLRGYHSLTSVLVEILITGDDLWIYDKSAGICYEGTVTELNNRGGLLNELRPSELSHIVLIQQYLLEGLESGKWKTYNDNAGKDKKHLRLIRQKSDKLMEVFAMRASDLLIQEAGLYQVSESSKGAQAQLIFNALIKRYTEKEGFLLPEIIEIYDRRSNARVTFEATDYMINPPLTDAVFKLKLPSSVVEKPLSALWEENQRNTK